jgi:Ca-activated chloride channel homolog
METRATDRTLRPFKSVALFCLLISGSVALTWPVGGQQPINQQRPRRVNDTQTSNTNKSKDSSLEEVTEGDVVRVNTQLVSVPTIVTDDGGHQLPALRAENFAIFENGQKQTIANFATTEAPFEIALLLDTSGSTRAELDLIRQAAIAFVNALRSGDRVAVIAFKTFHGGSEPSAAVEVLSKLTSDRKALRRAIDNIGSSNGTPFYDALARIAAEVFSEPARPEVLGRQAIVALTDGVDSSSEVDFAPMRSMLLRSALACYFIQLNTEEFVEDRLLKDCQEEGRLNLSLKQLQRYRRIFDPRTEPEDYRDFCRLSTLQRMQISRDLYNLARREMNELTKTTGGRNFVAASLQDAVGAFAQVAAQIGTQYSLGYYPTNKARDGQYRAIRVELTGVQVKARVRAREGYYAPKEN